MDDRGEPCGIPVLTPNRPVTFRFIAKVVLRSLRKLFNQSVIHFDFFFSVGCALVVDVIPYRTRRRRPCLAVWLLCVFPVPKSCEPVQLAVPVLTLWICPSLLPSVCRVGAGVFPLDRLFSIQ